LRGGDSAPAQVKHLQRPARRERSERERRGGGGSVTLLIAGRFRWLAQLLRLQREFELQCFQRLQLGDRIQPQCVLLPQQRRGDLSRNGGRNRALLMCSRRTQFQLAQRRL